MKRRVNRHGLFHREQIKRHLVNLALKTVDRHFAALHQIAKRNIAHTIRLNSSLDRLLRHAGHHQQALLKIIEFPVEANPHQPNLPVM